MAPDLGAVRAKESASLPLGRSLPKTMGFGFNAFDPPGGIMVWLSTDRKTFSEPSSL